MESFLSNIDHAHIATIQDGVFEEITNPTLTGKNRLAGIDFNKNRTRQVAIILLALSMKPGGFTSNDLSNEMAQRFKPGFTSRNASYDIKKFRGKEMVEKINGSIRYVLTEKGVKTISSILCILTKQIPSLVSVVKSQWSTVVKNDLLEMDEHLINISKETEQIRELHGITIVA